MSLAKKLSALVGVLAVGAGAAVAAHPAEAEGDSNIVLLGDSYMATTNQLALLNDHIQAAIPVAPRFALFRAEKLRTTHVQVRRWPLRRLKLT